MEEKKSCITSSKTNRTIYQCFYKKNTMVECPLYFKKFSVLFIVEHAADCSSKFDMLYVNSAHEVEDGKMDINDVTVPYGREEEEVDNVIQDNIEADTVTNDLRKKLQLLGEHSSNIQRHAWIDFCSFLSKPWVVAKQKCLVVKFIGEVALDTGGPVRVPFACKFIRLNFFS